MADVSEERMGFLFGLTGGILIVIGGFVALALGAGHLLAGHATAAFGAWSQMVLLWVIGGLAGLFAWLGHRSWKDRPMTAGLLLVAMAVLAWASLSLGANLLAFVGAILVVLGGVLYLIPPVTHRLRRPTPAAQS